MRQGSDENMSENISPTINGQTTKRQELKEQFGVPFARQMKCVQTVILRTAYVRLVKECALLGITIKDAARNAILEWLEKREANSPRRIDERRSKK